jgi:signal peptidase I
MIPSVPRPSERHALKCELADEVLRSAGCLRLQVMGWSMLPSVWPGDVLVIDRATSKQVSKGDIVLFRRDRRLFVHRVLRKAGESGNAAVLTRGDALPATDPPVSSNDLLGKVSLILRNGQAIEPRQRWRIFERAIAALARHSDIAARIVVGLHGLRQTPRTARSSACENRAVPCQS